MKSCSNTVESAKQLGLRVTERRVIRQPLSEPETQETTDRDVRARHPERLAHGPRPRHANTSASLTSTAGSIPGRPAPPGAIKRLRRPPHMVPIDQRLDPTQLIVARNQNVQTDHLHLPRLLTRPTRSDRTKTSTVS
jgi:hypothetical protein